MSVLKRIINNTYQLLINDEELLRLLYYQPEDLSSGQPNPLAVTDITPDIIDKTTQKSNQKLWEIINKHVMLTSKSDDLEREQLCRIYVYSGKTRSDFHNKRIAKQEVVIDVFCHSFFQEDQRLDAITDRLNKLLFNQRPDGLGRFDYRNGYDFVAPKEYGAYRHIFETTRTKS